MAAHLDLEEQEQLATLKHFWSRWGNLITWSVTGLMLAYAAWTGWQYWERRQAAQAGAMKEAVTQALASSNWTLAEQATTDLTQQFPKTHAASSAQLLLAKAALDQKKTDLARQSLNWVVQQGTDDALVSLARLRLAGLWLDEGKPDQAKPLLSVTPAPGFEALFDDRLGDWAQATQQNNLAVEHYSKAWKALSDTSAMRQVIAIKLAALGVDVSTLK